MLPAPLKKRIAALAAQNGTTPNAMILRVLEEHVAHAEWREFVQSAGEADRATDDGGAVHAAADVHAWLDRIARGKPTGRPRPLRD
jgi:predicted transcriptional regulator